jgi:hypothetical protein
MLVLLDSLQTPDTFTVVRFLGTVGVGCIDHFTLGYAVSFTEYVKKLERQYSTTGSYICIVHSLYPARHE